MERRGEGEIEREEGRKDERKKKKERKEEEKKAIQLWSDKLFPCTGH